MTDETALVVSNEMRLGSLDAAGSHDVIQQASEIATELKKIVKEKRLSKNISGREYVYVEGWSTLGAMLGVLPREVDVAEHDNGDFEATVELIRASDGEVIGRASSIVGSDEKMWASRPRYARRSMAVTRATGKAYRLGFSWIMTLAGYAPTPAEEMDGVVDGEYTEHDNGGSPDKMSLETAQAVTNSDGTKYGDLDNKTLSNMTIGINKALKKSGITDEQRETYQMKRDAIATILKSRAS